MAPDTTPKPSVGFCGLGAMGFGMATHLLKHGYPVKGFDVFHKTQERWRDAGGIVATSVSDSARDVPFYICMVASAPQVQTAMFGDEDGKGKGSGGIVEALPKGATFLLCSTVAAEYAKSVEAQLKVLDRDDIYFIDCPVSGGAIRAAAGTLSIMAGGSETALEKGRALLAELSEKLYIVPGGIGGGSNLKMAHQVLAGIQILAVSEGLGFAARLGLNAQEVVKAVNQSEAWSWMFENRSPRTLTEDYYPGASALTIILKDVGIITASSRLVHFPLPLTSLAEQVYTLGLSHGYGPHDDAGMVRLYHSSSPISAVTSATKPTSPQTVTTLTSSLSASSTSASSVPGAAGSRVDPLQLVLRHLRSVHAVAAGEAIAFAHHALHLDLRQFEDLVNDAAGGSAMFKRHCRAMAEAVVQQQSGLVLASAAAGSRTVVAAGTESDTTGGLLELVTDLELVVQEARKVECPIWLGSQALNVAETVLRREGQGAGVEKVVKYWG